MKKLIALIAILFAATAGSVAMADSCGAGAAVVAEEAISDADEAIDDAAMTAEEDAEVVADSAAAE